MATLTPQQAIDTCYQAGFRWNLGIVTMPAIGWAESRLKTDARGYNRDAEGNVLSVDRGWLQINSKYHPSMTDAQCDDPLEAAKYAFKISGGGGNFQPWSTFNAGLHRGPEGLVWALFMAEWRDYSARMQLGQKDVVIAELRSDLLACSKQLNEAKTAESLLRVELSEANEETELLSTTLARFRDLNDLLIAKIERAKADLA